MILGLSTQVLSTRRWEVKKALVLLFSRIDLNSFCSVKTLSHSYNVFAKTLINLAKFFYMNDVLEGLILIHALPHHSSIRFIACCVLFENSSIKLSADHQDKIICIPKCIKSSLLKALNNISISRISIWKFSMRISRILKFFKIAIWLNYYFLNMVMMWPMVGFYRPNRKIQCAI